MEVKKDNEVFLSFAAMDREVSRASSQVAVSIIRGVSSIQDIEHRISKKYVTLTHRKWKWKVKKLDKNFVVKFRQNFLNGDNVGSIICENEILGLCRWNLQLGSTWVGRRLRIWVALKNFYLACRSFDMVSCILAKIGEVKSLRKDLMSSADFTTLKAEIEVTDPCEIPSLIKLFVNEYYYEISLRRYMGDPKFVLDSKSFKKIVFEKDADGGLKIWRKKMTNQMQEGDIGNPIDLTSSYEDKTIFNSESGSNKVEENLGCYHNLDMEAEGVVKEDDKGKQIVVFQIPIENAHESP